MGSASEKAEGHGPPRGATTTLKVETREVRDAPPAEPSKDRGPEVTVDPDRAANGIARLVLTLVRFLHELMQRQAIRRMELGQLTPSQVERLGVALMKQAEELERI